MDVQTPPFGSVWMQSDDAQSSVCVQRSPKLLPEPIEGSVEPLEQPKDEAERSRMATT
jgi:hypothetical protein